MLEAKSRQAPRLPISLLSALKGFLFKKLSASRRSSPARHGSSRSLLGSLPRSSQSSTAISLIYSNIYILVIIPAFPIREVKDEPHIWDLREQETQAEPARCHLIRQSFSSPLKQKLKNVQTDARAQSIEVKIKKLDAELGRYKEQMSKLRAGPGKVRRSIKCVSILR